MPYGIHFVSESENPVGFWLWRIATAAQDAEEYDDEAGNLVVDVETTAVHGLVDHIPVVNHSVHQADQRLEADAASTTANATAANQYVASAQQVAAGKDPHDATTIAALQQIFAKVAVDRDSAKVQADQSFDQVERHRF